MDGFPVEVSQGDLLEEYKRVAEDLLRENLILKAALKRSQAETREARQQLIAQPHLREEAKDERDNRARAGTIDRVAAG